METKDKAPLAIIKVNYNDGLDDDDFIQLQRNAVENSGVRRGGQQAAEHDKKMEVIDAFFSPESVHSTHMIEKIRKAGEDRRGMNGMPCGEYHAKVILEKSRNDWAFEGRLQMFLPLVFLTKLSASPYVVCLQKTENEVAAMLMAFEYVWPKGYFFAYTY